MLRWLWSVLVRRDERRIFSYWDGKAKAAVDPIPTWYALYYDQGVSLEKEQSVIQLNDDRKTIEALLRLDPLIRKVFKVPAYESGGLTVDECQALLLDFLNWMGEVKKNGDGQQTSPEPTESAFLGQSTTSAASDSGRAASEPSSASPLA